MRTKTQSTIRTAAARLLSHCTLRLPTDSRPYGLLEVPRCHGRLYHSIADTASLTLFYQGSYEGNGSRRLTSIALGHMDGDLTMVYLGQQEGNCRCMCIARHTGPCPWGGSGGHGRRRVRDETIEVQQPIVINILSSCIACRPIDSLSIGCPMQTVRTCGTSGDISGQSNAT